MEYTRSAVLSKDERMQIMRSSLPHFNCLRTVEIFINGSIPIDLRCQYLLHFVSQLKNLRYFKLADVDCAEKRNIYKILEAAPNISTLDISQMTFLQHEIHKIARSLRGTHHSSDHQLLHLVLSDEHSSNTYDSFKDVMTFSFRETPRLDSPQF